MFNLNEKYFDSATKEQGDCRINYKTSILRDKDKVVKYVSGANRCGFSWEGDTHLFTWRLHVQQVEEVIHICLHSSGASMFSRLRR